MSRYPSAYGHTPSYRSVGGMPAYPSALGARDSDLLLGVTSFYQIQSNTLKFFQTFTIQNLMEHRAKEIEDLPQTLIF